MAIPPFVGCKFPDLLEKSLFDLNQELGDRIIANDSLLNDTAALINATNLNEVLDQANKTLDSLFDVVQTPQTVAYLNNMTDGSNSPLGYGALNANQIGDGSGRGNKNQVNLDPSKAGIQKGDDILETYGVPKGDATDADLETLLTTAGIVSVDGIMLPSGENSLEARYLNNIEILRSLYFATGKSLVEVENILSAGQLTYYTQTINYIKIPVLLPNQRLTLKDIQTAVSLPYLAESEYFQTTDVKNPYVLVLSSAYNGKEDVLSPDLAVKCFHVDAIDVSNSAHTKLDQKGFSQLDIEAIFSGQDFKDVNDLTTQFLTAAKAECSKAISVINFALTRLKSYSEAGKKVLQASLNDNILKVQELHKQVIANHISTVSITDSTLLEKLRIRFADDQIISILETRPDIKGMWIDATDEELANVILNASRSVAGTSIMSNKFVYNAEQQPTSLKTLMMMATYLEKAEEFNSGIIMANGKFVNFEQLLNLVKGYLVQYIGSDPYSPSIVAPPKPTYGGITEYTSPASAITEVGDTMTTFEVAKQVANIKKNSKKDLLEIYGHAVADPLSRVINAIADFFEVTMKAIQSLIDKAKNQIFAVKKKIDALFAKLMAVLGDGSFGNSVFKCAVSFDVALGLPILDDLLVLLDGISSVLSNFIGSIAKWIGDLLDKIICLPLNLLGMLTAAVVLPIPCAVKTFPGSINLGVNLEASLSRLKIAVDVQQMVLSGFGTDLVKCKMAATLLPSKIVSFKIGSVCNNDKVDNFYKASMLNIGF